MSDAIRCRRRGFRSLGLLVIVSLLLAGCAPFGPGTSSIAEYNHASLSPNNRQILLQYCSSPARCQIVIYDLESGTLRKVDVPSNKYRLNPRFSPDERQIVFVEGSRSAPNSRIVILNLNSGQVRAIAQTPTLKRFPTFSPDGKRILFVEVGRIEGNIPQWMDVHEVEVATGKQRQITKSKFIGFKRPPFFPNTRKYDPWRKNLTFTHNMILRAVNFYH